MLTRTRRQLGQALTAHTRGAPWHPRTPALDHRRAQDAGAVQLLALHAVHGDDTRAPMRLDLAEPAAWFAAQGAATIRTLIAEGERIVQAGEARGSRWASASLAAAAVGEELVVPCALVRPGQVQLSFDRVRGHVVKFLALLDGHPPEDIRTLAGQLGLMELPCIVGPRGRVAVLPDRNHNFAALLALIAWLSDQQRMRGRAPAALRVLADVFVGDSTGLTVKLRVKQNLSSLSPAAFADAMRERLFVEGVDGARKASVPELFSALENNPVRELVSRARVKVKRTGEGKRDFNISTKEQVVWVKGPAAPEYVEFFVAKIVARALLAAGRPYDGVRRVDRVDEELMRDALLAAEADPDHEAHAIFDRIVVVPRDLRDPARLKDALNVSRKTGAVRITR